jgi:hypothetical protein
MRNRRFAASAVGCFQSSVAPLSEKSVEEKRARRDPADLTRGDWKTTKSLGIVA